MKKSIETLCVHGDAHKYREASRCLTVPIYQTAAFSHLETGHNETGFDYTRLSNPTRQHLEETVSALEGAKKTIAFTSGMAAIPETKATVSAAPSRAETVSSRWLRVGLLSRV
jgi:O-acetylhomoserine/O-acetylserine sulfhydrylase-like pyridoxal-dependent enzyme